MDEEAALKAAANLDLPDRVSHKLWKARKSAYEFVLLQLSSTDGASQHKQFARLSPSMISDANPAAQDAACDAIIKLLQVCESSVVTDVASTLSKNVVAKTFKGRPALVTKSTEILMLLLEHECAEDVMRHVVAGYKDKVPKVAQAALAMTLTALQQFGPKVLLPSLFASSLVPVFDGRDVTSRKTAQDIVVELARWQGPDAARASILPKLRDAQKKDIEAMLEDLPSGRPVPERRTRSAHGSIDAGDVPPRAEEVPTGTKAPARAVQRNFDDDDVEVDIMAQIPKSMWSDVEDTKWSIRKAALTSLKTAASVQRAVPGDLHDIAAILKKVIQKDSNAACVAEACACVAALSKCMRKGFSNFAKSTFFALCLDKSKDKNAAVRARALEAVTAMHSYCTKLADVVEQVSVALGSPSPQVKQGTLTWLGEAVEMESAPEVKPLHKPILPLCAALCSDAVPAVRDGAVSAIAAFARVAGKLAAIEQHISALDDRRKKQVEEAVSGTSQNGSSSGAPSPPRPASRPGTSAGGRPGTPPVTGARPPLGGASRPGTAGAKRLMTTKTNKLMTSASSSAPPPAPTLQPTNLSKDDAKEFITEKYGEPILKGVENNVWKNRLEALTTIQESISSLDLKAEGPKVCLSLCYIPGWKDSNFQVLAKVCNICNEVVREMSQFAKGDAHTVITGVVDKLSDIKIQPHAWELLSTLAETTSLNFVMSELFKPASSHRSPKVYQASITWMARSMAEFGKASVDSKAAVGYAIDMLGHKDASVREAGTEFTAVLHEQMGARLDGMLAADVKSAMMDKVRARWGAGPAVTGEKQRTEKSKTAGAAKLATAAASSNGSVSARSTSSSAPPARVNYMPMPSLGGERSSDTMNDNEPRTDISSQITETLLKQMSDNNWKERKEAVETVESILQRAGGRIEPSFGGLLPALKLRIPDTNRNLAAQVIRLAASVCAATGHRFASAGRTIVLPILKACSDSKPAVQTAVAQFTTDYVSHCGWTSLGDAVSEAMGAKCTSGGRVVLLECFNSLVSRSHPPRDDQEAIVVLSAAAAGLQDKGLEPRRLAGELIGHLQGAGFTAIPPGANSLLSADKITALAEKMGTAEPPAIATQSIRTGRLQTIASTRTGARSASASGRPGTGGAPSRGSSADPRPATSAGGRGAPGKSALMTQSSTSSLPDDGEAMVHLVDETEKDDRRVPQRSFKFEQRLGEAKEVHAYLSPAISPSLASLMFSADFKKHCLACDKLVASLDTYILEMASVLDLLLRWSVLRFVEEKLQSVVKVQAFLTLLLERLALRSYQATDNEANVFLPCLCEKAGHNQERVRAGFAQLLSLFRAIYNPHRYVVFLLEGMDSKNIKSRAECCDALAETLREWGVDVLYHGPRSKRTSGAIKRLAGCTAERDAKLRKSALGALMVVFEQEGARFWQLLGDDLPSTQADLIKERAKFVEMEMVKRGAAPGKTAPTKAPARESSKSVSSSIKPGISSPNREAGAVASYEEPMAMPAVPSHLQTGPYPHAEPSAPNIAPAIGAHAQHTHAIASGAPPGMYQEPSTNALHTVPFVPGHPSGSGGVDSTPPPATARASYYTSYNAALQQLHQDQSGACVEAIKTIYWTLSSMGDGPQASAPVEDEAKVLIRSSINDVVMQLMSRSLVLSNLATTLALAQGTNPLRPLRYLMNCMLKIWEIRLSDLLEVPPMTLVTREVLAQLTNHRQIHATFAADGSALLRLLNMIMLKILESSNLNSIFAALLNCLLQIPDIVTTRGPTQVHCYLALTVKCLTKITKTRLSEEPVNLPTLVLDLHRYFSTLGPNEVRRLSNNNDKPLRMVKTMLHTVCKIYGYKVADTIAELPELRNLPQQPMVAMYADINLKSLAEIGMIAPRDGAVADGNAALAVAPPPAPAPVRSDSFTAAAPPARSDSLTAVNPPNTPPKLTNNPVPLQSTPPVAASGSATLSDKAGSSSAEPQALPLVSLSSRSASGLDADAAATAVTAGASTSASALAAATGNSMMSAERTASSVSSHAIGLVGEGSDSQSAAAAAPTALHRSSRSHISEPGSVAGSAASGSIKRTASNASAGAVSASAPPSAAAAAITTGTTVANGASVMSGVSGGISVPSVSRIGSNALSNAASGGITAQGEAPVQSQVNSSISEASGASAAPVDTSAAAPAAAVAPSGAGSGPLANSGSVPLAQTNSGMSGGGVSGANSGQLSARSAHSDSNRSGTLDSDEDEDDPGNHPDHFLSRIARRVESGGGEQPQPLQSSNTVNTSPGRHTGIGPTMPEDLREKVTETFNKIGMHNTTMMGLETLYNLLEENPSFPVEDLLSRTSEPFRQYISKGLQKVHKKRVKMRRAGHGRPHQPLPTVPEVNSNSRSASGTNDFVSPESERHRSVA